MKSNGVLLDVTNGVKAILTTAWIIYSHAVMIVADVFGVRSKRGLTYASQK